jgi:hypothetical protein
MTSYTNILLYLNFKSTAFTLTLGHNIILDYLVNVYTFDTLPAAVFVYCLFQLRSLKNDDLE